MAQRLEVVNQFHRLLEGEGLKDLSWAETLQQRMRDRGLVVEGRPVCPVIRPHFITRKQYNSLTKATEALLNVIERVETMALQSPALMQRLALLPAERMLAAVDPGYGRSGVAAMVRTNVNNGSMRIAGFEAGAPNGIAYNDVLGELFELTMPMRDVSKKFAIDRINGVPAMLDAILESYARFRGVTKLDRKPNICIVGHKQQFQSFESVESRLMAELFERLGCRTVVASPDMLEYRDGVLRVNDFPVQVVIRRVRLQDFLVRYGLDNALVLAYRDRAICMVNSFRSELADKQSIFDLLTDSELMARFPASERKAIAAAIPWTRLVGQRQTTHNEQVIDLPEWIRSHREELVLRPNVQMDDPQPEFVGAELDQKAWDRAIQTALRSSYVVQEAVPQVQQEFPLLRYGMLEVRKMNVDTQPQSFLGQVHGCASWVETAGSSFSSVAGVAPTFIVEK